MVEKPYIVRNEAGELECKCGCHGLEWDGAAEHLRYDHGIEHDKSNFSEDIELD